MLMIGKNCLMKLATLEIIFGLLMKTKAAILYKINQLLEIEEVETPQLNRGQVLVKVLYSGICHSQINEIKGRKGEDKYLPHLIGHEGSGVVEEIGPDVTKVKKGDYVVLSWIKGMGKDAPSSQYSRNGIKINSAENCSTIGLCSDDRSRNNKK